MTRFLCFAAAAALFTTAGPARADRAGVTFALDQMARAVLAGDPEAYLESVCTDCPIFAKEQQNWAADLKRHVPSAFALSIHEPVTDAAATDGEADKAEASAAAGPVFDDETGTARLELVMEWTMPGLGSGGKDVARTVSFPALFRRGEDGRWRYAGEDWRTVESGAEPDAEGGAAALEAAQPNRARYFDGFEQVARRAVAALPEVRAHVDEEFDNPVRHAQEIKIYPSMRHLQASIYLSYVDGLGGWNEPGESIKLLASDKTSIEGLTALLAHEYAHVATFELGERATDMPWWVLEGVADQSTERFAARRGGYEDKPEEYGREARSTMEAWARRGRIAPWDQISDFRNTPRQWSRHVYKQGQAMLGHIVKAHGRDARNQWLRAMATGSTIDEASRRALGFGFDELDRRWRASLPEAEVGEEEAVDGGEEGGAKSGG